MINSVQRGTATFSISSPVLNVPISAVNLSKSMVVATCSSGIEFVSGVTGRTYEARAKLTSSTNLQLNEPLNLTEVPASVDWEVVEYQ